MSLTVIFSRVPDAAANMFKKKISPEIHVRYIDKTN